MTGFRSSSLVFGIVTLLAAALPARAEMMDHPAGRLPASVVPPSALPAPMPPSEVTRLLDNMKPEERDLENLTSDAADSQATPLLMPEALSEAYLRNPDLEAARAQLRAVDEDYAQAMSGYRPVLNGNAGYTYLHDDGNVTESSGHEKSLSLSVDQPLYSGGSTDASVRASDNTIKAQRAQLAITEQQVLLAAITSYMDVVRDRDIVRLNLHNEKVLSGHLDEARQRFELGDVTKTDVSQAESRLASAIADRVAAESSYRASRADFEKQIGVTPEHLKKPDIGGISLPATLDDAIAIAEKNNPAQAYAQYNMAASKATTRAIEGELLPQVDLVGSVGRVYDPFQNPNANIDQTTVGVTATIPLYTSGSVDSRVRQSRQTTQQLRQQMSSAERLVRQGVIDAWTNLAAANAEISARDAQIKAAKLALDGVEIEAKYGSRTTLDMLDAEQEYLSAQVDFVAEETERTVATYTMLASMGALTAKDLQLNVPLYDPTAHFQNVKNKWIGTHVSEPAPPKSASAQ